MRTTLAALGVAFAMGCHQMTDGNAQAASGGVPAEMIEAMRGDAATRAGVSVSAVKVESALGVTWPDASLGCPRPGMLYPQVLVPGWRGPVAWTGIAVMLTAPIARATSAARPDFFRVERERVMGVSVGSLVPGPLA